MTCVGYTLKGKQCKNKPSKQGNYCHLHNKMYKFDKPEECPICMDNINEELRPLDCGHWVHKQCLLKWNDICPTCRNPIKLSRSERRILNKNTDKIENPVTIQIDLTHIDITDVNQLFELLFDGLNIN